MAVTDVDTLRHERGQGDTPLEVALSDRLTVEVLLDSAEIMIYMNKIPSPLMQALIDLGDTDDAEKVGIEAVRQKAELQDAVMKSIVVNPPWCDLETQTRTKNTRPKGMLTLGMLTDEEIGAGFALVYKGVEGLKTFRANRQRRLALLPEREISPTPEPDSVSAPDTLDTLLAGRSGAIRGEPTRIGNDAYAPRDADADAALLERP